MNKIELFLHGWIAAQCTSTLFEDDFLSFSSHEQQLFKHWKGDAQLWEDVPWLPIFRELTQHLQDEEQLKSVYNMVISTALTFTTYSYSYASQFKDMLDYLHREKFVNSFESYSRIVLGVQEITEETSHNYIEILGFMIDCWVNHTNETSPLDDLHDWSSIQAKCTQSASLQDLKFHSNYLREQFVSNQNVWTELWTKFANGSKLDDCDISSIWDHWYEWIETGHGTMASIFEQIQIHEMVAPFLQSRSAYVHMINQNEMNEALAILLDSCEPHRVNKILQILEISTNHS